MKRDAFLTAPAAAVRPAPACRCSAYRFPHRAASGKCQCAPFLGVDETRLSRPPAMVLPALCEGCGLPATTHAEDYGYGVTEFWGSISNHVDLVEETDCCGAALVPNAEWRTPCNT